MKTYYIYHIPTIKIGCTTDLEKRMSDQGFIEWEILETHTDGWVAGNREIELQKEYGLPVDKVHYMIAIQNRRKWTIEDTYKGLETRQNHIMPTKEAMSRGGITAMQLMTKEQRALGARNSHKIKKECPHCGKVGSQNLMTRWHFDNCKMKQSK